MEQQREDRAPEPEVEAGTERGASAEGIVASELRGLTRLLVENRNYAMSRLRAAASARGLNAVVGLRQDSSEIRSCTDEVIAYGTAAVTVQPTVKPGHRDEQP